MFVVAGRLFEFVVFAKIFRGTQPVEFFSMLKEREFNLNDIERKDARRTKNTDGSGTRHTTAREVNESA